MDRFEKKAKELVSQMTAEEKCSQLKYEFPRDRAAWHTCI